MAYLEISTGDKQGTNISLVNDTSIGRSTDNVLCLLDSSVSRHHAAIRKKDNYYAIVDLGSANGTVVNRRPLHRLVPQPLYENDEVVICATKMIFRSEGDDPVSTKRIPYFQAAGAPDLIFPTNVSNVSVVMKTDSRLPDFSASIDVSRASLVKDEEHNNVEGLTIALNRLTALIKISQDLGALTKPEALFDRIMNVIFEIFPAADRAFIMLREGDQMQPKCARTRDMAASPQELCVSKTLIEAVVSKRQSVLSSDAQQDERFATHQSMVNLSIRSLMCAPFIYKEDILGIIGVDTKSGTKTFTADDLMMLTSISAQAAIAIKNADLFETVESETQVRTQLARYLSPDVVEGVLEGTIPLTLGGEKKHGTLFFCDIVGFTRMSESLPATDVVEKLNMYFSVTTEIITRNKGTLHKFGGDMIMAFWNVLFPDDAAQVNAIAASLEMQVAVWLFDCDLEAAGQFPVYIGIGCNTGEFAGGNVGGEDRMEYTVIGDNVNLAQRIESLASRWQVFVAESTYAPAAAHCIAIKLPPVNVKGKSMPIQIYSIRGIERGRDEIILDIPVKIVLDGGLTAGAGMLTGLMHRADGITISLSSTTIFAQGSRLTLDFSLPELKRPLSITVLVTDVDRSANGGAAASFTLSEITGDEALEFLVPGACIESHMLWPDMVRH